LYRPTRKFREENNQHLYIKIKQNETPSKTMLKTVLYSKLTMTEQPSSDKKKETKQQKLNISFNKKSLFLYTFQTKQHQRYTTDRRTSAPLRVFTPPAGGSNA